MQFHDEIAKPSITFSKLPLEIIGEVVKRLDPISRIAIRNVSKTLRAVSDAQKLNIREMQISESFLYVNLKVNEKSIFFSCVKRVQAFVRRFLTHPKLKIEFLYLEGEDDLKHFQQVVDIFNGVFHVKSFKICTSKPVSIERILGFMKPRVLESIKIKQFVKHLSVDTLIETEQFKQAKTVIIRPLIDFKNVDSFLHLASFELVVRFFPHQEIIPLRDKLSNRPNFRKCQISVPVYLQFKQMAIALQELIRETDGRIVHRHPIPGSNDYLLMDFHGETVTIERKKQN